MEIIYVVLSEYIYENINRFVRGVLISHILIGLKYVMNRFWKICYTLIAAAAAAFQGIGFISRDENTWSVILFSLNLFMLWLKSKCGT